MDYHFFQWNNHKIPVSEILQHSISANAPETVKTSLAFAKEWMAGSETFIQHTSGSTGTPKAIQISRSQMQASAKGTIESLQLSAGDTALLCINPGFIGGKMMIVRAIEHQLNLLIGEVTANPLAKLDENLAIDFFSFVPYQLESILQQTPGAINLLNKAKAIILGGAPVSAALENQIRQHISAPTYSTFGMTETVSHIALKRLNGQTNNETYTALEGVKISADSRGCLSIEAESITNTKLLQTNDLVTLRNTREFIWLGRIDHVINSGGIKISLDILEKELEQLFWKHQINNRFFLYGTAHATLGQALHLVLEGSTDVVALEKIIRDNLPKYHIPKAIKTVTAFAETGSGKIDRKATKHRFEL